MHITLPYNFSIIRSLALLLLLFSFNSSSLGVIGFLVINFALAFNSSGIYGRFKSLESLHKLLNTLLTILSSNEWKLITHNLPPTFNKSNASNKACSRISSSWLTSILIAWNVFLAGCDLFL